MDDITLRKVGEKEPEKNLLPRGVVLVLINNEPFFVRKVGARLVQLSEKEQNDLKKKHIK